MKTFTIDENGNLRQRIKRLEPVDAETAYWRRVLLENARILREIRKQSRLTDLTEKLMQ